MTSAGCALNCLMLMHISVDRPAIFTLLRRVHESRMYDSTMHSTAADYASIAAGSGSTAGAGLNCNEGEVMVHEFDEPNQVQAERPHGFLCRSPNTSAHPLAHAHVSAHIKTHTHTHTHTHNAHPHSHAARTHRHSCRLN